MHPVLQLIFGSIWGLLCIIIPCIVGGALLLLRSVRDWLFSQGLVFPITALIVGLIILGFVNPVLFPYVAPIAIVLGIIDGWIWWSQSPRENQEV